MNAKNYWLAVMLLLFGNSVAAHGSRPDAVFNEWKSITPPKQAVVIDGNGQQRSIYPSCSGGPVCQHDENGNPISCQLENADFQFYFHRGNSEKLLVFMDGGGACWDDESCSSFVYPPGTYLPTLTSRSNPNNVKGIFDLRNPDNPFRDYSMVFIPYCTGDIHWGSNDVEYNTGIFGQAELLPEQITIHHRGFDNFLAVREWLKNRFDDDEDEEKVSKLVVAGVSAGSYGASLALPYLKQLFPKARTSLIGDSGNGVVTDQFIHDAVGDDDAAWNARPNFPHWIPEFGQAASGPSETFSTLLFTSLAQHYPRVRMAQYTSAWDAIQPLFYNIMLTQEEEGSTAAEWFDLSPENYAAWAYQAQAYMQTNAQAPNYRFYVAPGCVHTALRFSEELYQTNAQGNNFSEWLGKMAKGRARHWENVSCNLDDPQTCPPPLPEDVPLCLQKTFGG